MSAPIRRQKPAKRRLWAPGANTGGAWRYALAVKRAKSITGLFWQAAQIRWKALPKAAKYAAIAGLALFTLAATQAALYAMCPCSARSACSRTQHEAIAPVSGETAEDGTNEDVAGTTPCSAHRPLTR